MAKTTTEAAWRLEKEWKRDEAERKRVAAKSPAEERRWRASRDNYKRQLTMGWRVLVRRQLRPLKPGMAAMPKGPRGEKRPADVISGAVKVMRIATGEEPNNREDAPALTPGQQLGKLGGAARARKLTAEQRGEIARKAAAKRWEKSS